MANFADLVIGVNTKALVKGKAQLDKTTSAAGKTELAVDGAGNAFVKAGAKSKASTAAMAAGIKKVQVAAVLAAAGILTVAASTARFISGTVELEKVQAQLGAAILSTGGAANRSQSQLNQFASELQGVTNFGDEAINAMQGVLLTFTQIEGVNFDAATTATLDLATAMGTDMKSAALQVGKALNDPVLGMTALSRSGIQFTEAQKDVVKAMVATNDIAGAQAIILKELETQFGGSAEAARNTLGGALTSLRNAWGDLFEVTGPAANSLRLAVEGLIGTITDPRFVTAAAAIGAALFGMAELGISALNGLASVIGFMGENIDAVSGIVIAASGTLLAVYTPAIVAATIATAGWVLSLVTLKGALLATGIGALVVGAGLLIGQFLKLVRATGGFGDALATLGNLAIEVWGRIGAGASFVTNSVAAMSSKMSAFFISAIRKMAGTFVDFTWTVADGINALFGTSLFGVSAVITQELGLAEMAARRAAEGYESAANSAKEAFTAPLNSLSLLEKQTAAAEEESKKLNKTLTDTGGKKGAAATAEKAVADYASTMKDAGKSMEEMGVAKANILISGIDSVSGAFGDWISSGFKDFKGFASSILDTFKNMLSQMIAMAVKNKIMIGLGFGGGGAAGAAQAATGGGGGILSSLLGGGGGGGGGGAGGAGILGKIGGIGSALGTGFSSSLAGFASGGLSGGFGAIGAQLSATAAGGGLASIAASIGAVAVPLLAVVAVFSFFKKKTKELDAGIRLTIDGMDTLAEGFKVIETRRFWGLSKKVATTFTALDAAVAGPLEKAVNSIFIGIAGAADSLGIGAEAFDAFTSQITISTKGLSKEDANKAVQDALTVLGDRFAAMIPGLAALQKEGEGANDAIVRLSTSLSVVNDAFQSLDFVAYEASLSGAAAASSFVELFGTIDNFVSATASYYDAFYTADEKRADATARLTASLDALGISALPNDRSGFRALVDTAQAAGDEELTAALIMLAPSFANLSASVDELSQTMRNQVEERNFATGVDFRRGLARASSGIEYTPKDSAAEMLIELKALNARVDLLQSTSEFTAANTGATANNTEDQLTVLETTA